MWPAGLLLECQGAVMGVGEKSVVYQSTRGLWMHYGAAWVDINSGTWWRLLPENPDGAPWLIGKRNFYSWDHEPKSPMGPFIKSAWGGYWKTEKFERKITPYPTPSWLGYNAVPDDAASSSSASSSCTYFERQALFTDMFDESALEDTVVQMCCKRRRRA